MKVLVFYLYFANSKGSGCAFMRILSYIDFYNQFSAFKGKKKIYIFFENFFFVRNKKKKKKKKKLFFFFFFEKFYCQKWPTRMIPMTSAYQFINFKVNFLWLTNLFMISYQLLHMYTQKSHFHGNMTSFLSWILPMLSWFYVQDRYLSCQRTILGSIFHTQEAYDTKKVHVYS